METSSTQTTNTIPQESVPTDFSTSDQKTEAVADPFSNLKSLRLSQDYVQMAGVKKVNTSILVRKPGKQEFVRTIGDPSFWFTTNLLIIQEDRDTYLVDSAVAEWLEGDVKPHVLIPAISKQGAVFLWPVQISGLDNIAGSWHSSALEAAKLARDRWVRIYFKSLAAGQYEVLTAKADFPDPEWPKHSLSDYLRLAFKDKLISDLNHTAVRRLLGQEE